MNDGENHLLLRKCGEIVNLSRKLTHGKIGLLKLVVGSEDNIRAQMRPYEERLSPGDRVLICSDGVGDLEGIDDVARMRCLEDLLKYEKDVNDVVIEANRSLRDCILQDDYTLICLERKQ